MHSSVFDSYDLDLAEDSWKDFLAHAFADCAHSTAIIRKWGFEGTNWPKRLEQYFKMIKSDRHRLLA